MLDASDLGRGVPRQPGADALSVLPREEREPYSPGRHVGRGGFVYLAAALVVASALATAFWIRLPGLVPSDADHRELAAYLAEHREGGVVTAVPDYTDRARLFVPDLSDLDPADVGIEDLQGADRLWVIAAPGLPRSTSAEDVARIGALPFLGPSERRTFGSLELVGFSAQPVRFALPGVAGGSFREVGRHARSCLLLAGETPHLVVDVPQLAETVSGGVGIVTSLAALDRSHPAAELVVEGLGRVEIPAGDESFHRFRFPAAGTTRLELSAHGLSGRTLCVEMAGW